MKHQCKACVLVNLQLICKPRIGTAYKGDIKQCPNNTLDKIYDENTESSIVYILKQKSKSSYH